jgi:hypothetical protein
LSAINVPEPTTTASASARNRCASARAAALVISGSTHLRPHRPSRLAAYFQVTCGGRPHRRQPDLVEASRLNGGRPISTSIGAAQNVAAPARGLVRIAYCRDHTAYPRRDERLGARTGQTGVCAGLE